MRLLSGITLPLPAVPNWRRMAGRLYGRVWIGTKPVRLAGYSEVDRSPLGDLKMFSMPPSHCRYQQKAGAESGDALETLQ